MTTDRRVAMRAAALLTGLVVLAACGATGSTPSAADPSAPPASPSPAPSVVGPDGATIDLVNATGNDIAVEIRDDSGLLAAAESGTPGDGASVEPYTVAVANDDPTTLRLTWAGGPCDALDTLAIDATGRQLLLVEPECPGDAVAFDRVLVLRFSEPVTAADVQVILQDGTDTPG